MLPLICLFSYFQKLYKAKQITLIHNLKPRLCHFQNDILQNCTSITLGSKSYTLCSMHLMSKLKPLFTYSTSSQLRLLMLVDVFWVNFDISLKGSRSRLQVYAPDLGSGIRFWIKAPD